MAAGMEGLREAALHYDPSSAASFSTYAYFWLRLRMARTAGGRLAITH